MSRLLMWVLCGVAAATLPSACAGGSPRRGRSSDSVEPSLIRIDGSSTVYPITEAVAEEFHREYPDARVTVGISGTGGGFQKFCHGETDISDASRPIRPIEMERCEKAAIAFVELPVAYDGLAVVVNSRNNWLDTLTVSELKRIWEPSAEGRIVRWNQVRSSWPDRELHLFGPGVDSGTFDYFTEVIVGQSGASRGDFTSSEDDNTIVQGVGTDPLGLGYFGYSYYAENQDTLKLVSIDDENPGNGDGPIRPSPETVGQGTYAPLSRPIFTYVTRAALNRPEVASFVDFYLTHAAALVREVGYVPLSAREYQLAMDRLKAGVTGTMFGGDVTVGAVLEARMSRGLAPR